MLHISCVRLPFTFFLLLILSACGGGGGDSDSTPPAVSTGILVDSPVVGIHYDSQPSGKSGTTGAGGEYDYVAGDTVTFSIGVISFPPVTAAAVITPLTMAGTTDVTDPQATNIAILLQSLDADPTDDVITIDAATVTAATTAVNFDQSTTDFITIEQAVTDLIMATDSTLVDATVAQNHVTDTLAALNKSIVGAWTSSSEPWGLSSHGMLVFYDNGFYIHWQDASNDPNCALGNGGTGGVEYGTYSLTGTDLTMNAIVDETIDCGPNSGVGTSIIPNASVSGDVLNLDGFTAERVDGGADSLVGAWDIGASVNNPFGLVFYNNGFYMQWQGPGDNPDCLDGGVEYGTYVYTPTNENGIAATPIYDENATCGLSGTPSPGDTSHIAGDVLTFTDTETFILNRVVGSGGG